MLYPKKNNNNNDNKKIIIVTIRINRGNNDILNKNMEMLKWITTGKTILDATDGNAAKKKNQVKEKLCG